MNDPLAGGRIGGLGLARRATESARILAPPSREDQASAITLKQQIHVVSGALVVDLAVGRLISVAATEREEVKSQVDEPALPPDRALLLAELNNETGKERMSGSPWNFTAILT